MGEGVSFFRGNMMIKPCTEYMGTVSQLGVSDFPRKDIANLNYNLLYKSGKIGGRKKHSMFINSLP